MSSKRSLPSGRSMPTSLDPIVRNESSCSLSVPTTFPCSAANAQLGRVFGPQDQAQGFAEGVVISDGLWHRLFAADPNILGRKVYADSDLYTVIGVMPPGFRHPGQTLRNEVDIWGTAGFAANPFGPPIRAQRILPGAIGRLKPGSERSAGAGKARCFHCEPAGRVSQRISSGRRLVSAPLAGTRNSGRQRADYAAGVAWRGRSGTADRLREHCQSNACSLFRTAARDGHSPGAGRQPRPAGWRNCSPRVCCWLSSVERSALLMVICGAESAARFVPADIPRLQEVGVNLSVLGFVFLVSLVTGLLFGLVPALQASRPDVVVNLKDGSLGAGSGARHHRFRSSLVVVEFALSLMLMIGAGLLLRSFGRLLEVQAGLRSAQCPDGAHLVAGTEQSGAGSVPAAGETRRLSSKRCCAARARCLGCNTRPWVAATACL